MEAYDHRHAGLQAAFRQYSHQPTETCATLIQNCDQLCGQAFGTVLTAILEDPDSSSDDTLDILHSFVDTDYMATMNALTGLLASRSAPPFGAIIHENRHEALGLLYVRATSNAEIVTALTTERHMRLSGLMTVFSAAVTSTLAQAPPPQSPRPHSLFRRAYEDARTHPVAGATLSASIGAAAWLLRQSVRNE